MNIYDFQSRSRLFMVDFIHIKLNYNNMNIYDFQSR